MVKEGYKDRDGNEIGTEDNLFDMSWEVHFRMGDWCLNSYNTFTETRNTIRVMDAVYEYAAVRYCYPGDTEKEDSRIMNRFQENMPCFNPFYFDRIKRVLSFEMKSQLI